MKYALVKEQPVTRRGIGNTLSSSIYIGTRLVEIAISDSYEALEELQENNKILKDCKIIER